MSRRLPLHEGSVAHQVLSVACATELTVQDFLDRLMHRGQLPTVKAVRMALYRLRDRGYLAQTQSSYHLTPEGEAELDRLWREPLTELGQLRQKYAGGVA